MHRILIEGAHAGALVALRGAPLRHLRTVLRLAPGDQVELFDGSGRSFSGEIRTVGATSAEILVLEECFIDRESPLALTLAIALSRGAKPDWIIEKATELGVSAVIPFTSERTLQDSQRHDRWERLAVAAARQSGRARCPEVAKVSSFADVLDAGGRSDLALLFDESASGFPEEIQELHPRSVLAVTGPEGGFSGAEVSAARESGFEIVNLGPRTLRAETAGITTVALCQIFWGDLIGGS